jgi:hypothetical protein
MAERRLAALDLCAFTSEVPPSALDAGLAGRAFARHLELKRRAASLGGGLRELVEGLGDAGAVLREVNGLLVEGVSRAERGFPETAVPLKASARRKPPSQKTGSPKRKCIPARKKSPGRKTSSGKKVPTGRKRPPARPPSVKTGASPMKTAADGPGQSGLNS